MLVRCTPALRKGLMAALFALMLAQPAVAQENADLFTVRDVPVDVTAASALEARDQGMREGQRKAFEALFERLTPDGARSRLPSLDSTTIDSMVQSFQVQEERTSSVRYLGRLAVTFNANAVRRFMRDNAIPYTEVRSRPVLVLPVDQSQGAPLLWQAETAWRQAWADLPAQAGLVPVLVPYGEAPDVADIGAEQAMAGESEPLRRIGARYEAGEVAVAVLTPTSAGGMSATITLYGDDGSAPTSFTVTQEAVAPTDDGRTDPTLAALVEKIVGRLDERWVAANVVTAGPESEMTLRVAFTSPQEWIDTRKRLTRVPTVTSTRLLTMSRDSASLEVRYSGDSARLRSALAQQDLALTEGPDGPTLRRRGAGN